MRRSGESLEKGGRDTGSAREKQGKQPARQRASQSRPSSVQVPSSDERPAHCAPLAARAHRLVQSLRSQSESIRAHAVQPRLNATLSRLAVRIPNVASFSYPSVLPPCPGLWQGLIALCRPPSGMCPPAHAGTRPNPGPPCPFTFVTPPARARARALCVCPPRLSSPLPSPSPVASPVLSPLPLQSPRSAPRIRKTLDSPNPLTRVLHALGSVRARKRGQRQRSQPTIPAASASDASISGRNGRDPAPYARHDPALVPARRASPSRGGEEERSRGPGRGQGTPRGANRGGRARAPRRVGSCGTTNARRPESVPLPCACSDERSAA